MIVRKTRFKVIFNFYYRKIYTCNLAIFFFIFSLQAGSTGLCFILIRNFTFPIFSGAGCLFLII